MKLERALVGLQCARRPCAPAHMSFDGLTPYLGGLGKPVRAGQLTLPGHTVLGHQRCLELVLGVSRASPPALNLSGAAIDVAVDRARPPASRLALVTDGGRPGPERPPRSQAQRVTPGHVRRPPFEAPRATSRCRPPGSADNGRP